MGDVYSSEVRKTETPDQSSLGSTGTSYESLSVPFKVLCDNATQTEKLEDDGVGGDSSVEINAETFNGSDVDIEDNYVSTRSSPVKCFCDAFIQTEFVSVGVSNVWDSCIQTDDVIIRQLETSVDCDVQTEVDCSMYNESCVQTDDIIIKQLTSSIDSYVQTEVDKSVFNESCIQTDDVIIKELETSVDSYAQTEVDCSMYNESYVQTDDIIIKQLTSLIDSYVQTEVDENVLNDSCIQTDDVIIKQLENSVDCYVQTEGDKKEYCESCIQTDDIIFKQHENSIDCYVQTEGDNASIDHKASTPLCNDYLHFDDTTASSATNESEEVTHCKMDDIKLHDTTEGNYFSSVVESELVEEQIPKYNISEELNLNSSEDDSYNTKSKGVDRSHGNVNTDEEWKARYIELEKKVEEEIAMRELLEVAHREKLEYLQEQNKGMKQVVGEYENVIVELTERSGDRVLVDKTLTDTISEKEQVQQDLNKAEGNLMDAYKRIEKLKVALDTYKGNEETMKSTIEDFQTKLEKSEEKYKKLRNQATEKMDAANTEIAKVRKQKEIDLAGLQAALKKSQNRNTSLEKEIEQKVRETTELSQICDELIQRVSVE